MKRKLILILLAAVTVIVLSIPALAAGDEPPMNFADVKSDSWYYSYVERVYAAGIMEGKSVSAFDPEGVVTRAEFVTAMARIAGADVSGEAHHVTAFPDADKNAWYAPYMGWAVGVGLVNGRDGGLLAPNATVSRAEIAVLTDRLLSFMGLTLPYDLFAEKSFDDVTGKEWYGESITLMRKTALINGDGTGSFNPDDTAQRHSMAAIISRFLVKCSEARKYKVGLPVITIDTETGGDVESKEEYIRCAFTLKDTDGRDISDGSVRIRGRGNATWKFEKKAYRLKFDENVCLMSYASGGTTENKDWTLIANHCDKSLIRNHAAQSLGRELDGIEWAPYTELVEVYLNGKYHGVYMLCEQVEVGEQRVDIKDGEDDDVGFLFELDGYAEGEYNIDFFTVQGRKYTVKGDVKDADQVIAMKLHLETVLNIIREGNKDKVAKYVDLDSAVDMYILQELMRNLDAGWSSFYLYSYGPHDKLFFGPPWDFDLAGGNSYNCHAEEGLYVGQKTGPDGTYLGAYTNEWFASLLANKWFREMVRDRFNEKSADLLNVVDSCCKEAYMNMEYLERNFERWDVIDELINQEPMPILMLDNCEENVEYFAAWMLERHDWLKAYYNTDKFIVDFEAGEIPEIGVTEVVDADVWTIPDWFEGDKLAQIYMDILFSSMDTKDGRIIVRLGRADTVTEENLVKVMLEGVLGAEKGRFKMEIEGDKLAAFRDNYRGLGYGQGNYETFRFKFIDTVTGDESTTQEYVILIIKDWDMDQILG